MRFRAVDRSACPRFLPRAARLVDPSRSGVHAHLQLPNRFDHFVKPRNFADDHPRHPLVIAAEIYKHVRGWPEDKCAPSRGIQPEVWIAEKHVGTDTIPRQSMTGSHGLLSE